MVLWFYVLRSSAEKTQPNSFVQVSWHRYFDSANQQTNLSLIYLFILTYKIREFRLFICSQVQSKIKFCTGAHKPQAACSVPLQGTWYSEKQSNIHCIFSVNTFFPIRTQIQANARYLDNNNNNKKPTEIPTPTNHFLPLSWLIYLSHTEMEWGENSWHILCKKKIIN